MLELFSDFFRLSGPEIPGRILDILLQIHKQPHTMMKRIILLIIAALRCCVVDGALSTVVESGEEECFVVRAKANSLIR